MKKKRFALVFSISLIALLVMALGLAAAASASDSAAVVGGFSAPAAQKAPTAGIAITLTDISAFQPYSDYTNGIATYYDHNAIPDPDFFGAAWIGVLVTNTEDSPQSVGLQIELANPLTQTYDPLFADQNYFMLGRGQEPSIVVPDIPAHESQIYYFYVATPRFKTDPAGECEIFTSPSTRGPCGSKIFTVTATPDVGTPMSMVGTIVMDGVQTANPGEIQEVVEDGVSTFTLTVFYESGNLCTASGTCAGSYAPTTHNDYDASVMHLISVTAVATDTDGTVYSPTNRMRMEAPGGSIDLNQDPVKFTFIFERDKQTSVTFYPSYAANSGSDNYKGAALTTGVPTAITLLDLEATPLQPLTFIAAAVVFLLGATSLLLLRRRQRE